MPNKLGWILLFALNINFMVGMLAIILPTPWSEVVIFLGAIFDCTFINYMNRNNKI